jgi:hypothetical protein
MSIHFTLAILSKKYYPALLLSGKRMVDQHGKIGLESTPDSLEKSLSTGLWIISKKDLQFVM